MCVGWGVGGGAWGDINISSGEPGELFIFESDLNWPKITHSKSFCLKSVGRVRVRVMTGMIEDERRRLQMSQRLKSQEIVFHV